MLLVYTMTQNKVILKISSGGDVVQYVRPGPDGLLKSEWYDDSVERILFRREHPILDSYYGNSVDASFKNITCNIRNIREWIQGDCPIEIVREGDECDIFTELLVYPIHSKDFYEQFNYFLNLTNPLATFYISSINGEEYATDRINMELKINGDVETEDKRILLVKK